ncbi:peptidylprolyl isomerase [Flavobacterium branchiophilum]|nr:peptidylprolyl isomerase [Flavobacterium branchiophilum]
MKMNLKKWFSFIIIILLTKSYAQSQSKDILFTIDDKPFYTDEFARVYLKNLDLVKDDSQKDLDKYLDLYIGYKLKVQKALKIGLQNNDRYKNELIGYRAQLSRTYFTDTKITQKLLDEAYQRALKEIKASHILITCDENAPAADTLKAYQQLLDIKKRAENGENFGTLAALYSQDPSAKSNSGQLGYFSVFRMVYPFETAAYQTPKGALSSIIRTRFGYHLIKVEDIRDNRGEVIAAHIMIGKTLGSGEAEDMKTKAMIDDIYKKLQQGESFESLAKTYSQDKASAPKGGVLSRFGAGQLNSEEFEDTALGLTLEKPISTPFLSNYGWHIVKLIEKFPVKSFTDMKPFLEDRLAKDDRSKLIIQSLTSKLKAKYKIQKNLKSFEAAKKTVTNDIYNEKWIVPLATPALNNDILTINEEKISTLSFLNYVKEQEKNKLTLKPIDQLVDHLYDEFESEKLRTYYDQHLEMEYPEFKYVVEEYKEGLLLFDLMEKEIWEKSKSDTTGLKNYFDWNKNQYKQGESVAIIIASSINKDVVKKAQKLLSKNTSTAEIKEALNTNEVINIIINQGIYEKHEAIIPKNTKIEQGVSDITKEGDYYFVTKINQVIPERLKTFEEAKGRLINDYQNYLETNWIQNLKKEFKVQINSTIFEKIKKEIQTK